MTAKQIHSQKNQKDDVQTHKYINSRGWVKKIYQKTTELKKNSPVPQNINKIKLPFNKLIIQ